MHTIKTLRLATHFRSYVQTFIMGGRVHVQYLVKVGRLFTGQIHYRTPPIDSVSSSFLLDPSRLDIQLKRNTFNGQKLTHENKPNLYIN